MRNFIIGSYMVDGFRLKIDTMWPNSEPVGVKGKWDIYIGHNGRPGSMI